MLPQSAGEVVIAGKILLGTHIYIGVLGGIEYALDGCDAWYAYGARGKAGIFVGVLGRVDCEVGEENAA